MVILAYSEVNAALGVKVAEPHREVYALLGMDLT